MIKSAWGVCDFRNETLREGVLSLERLVNLGAISALCVHLRESQRWNPPHRVCVPVLKVMGTGGADVLSEECSMLKQLITQNNGSRHHIKKILAEVFLGELIMKPQGLSLS